MKRKQKRLPIVKLQSPYGDWQKAYHPNALRRAWIVVRAKKGGSGSDNITLAEYEQNLEQNLQLLSQKLTSQTYRPKPVKQILVPKSGGKWRTLTVWNVHDRIAQRATYHYLEPVFERQFLSCSYGFRTGRSTKDAAEAIWAERKKGAHWVFDADIKDCFGRMSNRRVLQQLGRWRVPNPVRQLIHYWLHTDIGNAWRADQKHVGTSQGSVISPLLCNLYLHAFDKAMQKPGIRLVRYADDFVLLARRRGAILFGEKWAKQTLWRIGLELHPHKTRITTFQDGFQFVGWFFVNDEMYRLR